MYLTCALLCVVHPLYSVRPHDVRCQSVNHLFACGWVIDQLLRCLAYAIYCRAILRSEPRCQPVIQLTVSDVNDAVLSLDQPYIGDFNARVLTPMSQLL